MKVKNVAGIRDLEVHANVNRGQLALPADFDTKKYVGRWAKKGVGTERSRNPQSLGNGQQADGWQVYKGRRNEICQKTLSDGVYVLMFRPKALQRAVNAILGNVSKARITKEHDGETIEGESTVPFGMLPESSLKKMFPQESPEALPMQFNRIDEPDTASAAKATSKKKFKL
jgi:hypothetical protein